MTLSKKAQTFPVKVLGFSKMIVFPHKNSYTILY